MKTFQSVAAFALGSLVSFWVFWCLTGPAVDPLAAAAQQATDEWARKVSANLERPVPASQPLTAEDVGLRAKVRQWISEMRQEEETDAVKAIEQMPIDEIWNGPKAKADKFGSVSAGAFAAWAFLKLLKAAMAKMFEWFFCAFLLQRWLWILGLLISMAAYVEWRARARAAK